MSDEDKPDTWRTLTRIGLIAGIIASFLAILGFLATRTATTTSSPTPTPVPTTSPTPVNCLGHQPNVTIRNLDIPPSQLTVEIVINGNAGSATQVQAYFYCDGNTVEFPNSDQVLCNGVTLKYITPLFAGPSWYGGNVAPVAAGKTYTFQYKRADGTSYSIPITAMSQVNIATPPDGATVPIPKSGSLAVAYGVGSSDSRVSAVASDGNGRQVAASDQADTGTMSLTGDFTSFMPGPGSITVTRAKGNVGVVGTALGGATLNNYRETATIRITWQ